MRDSVESEVWRDANGYEVLVRRRVDGAFEIYDPKENRVDGTYATYAEVENELWLDEFERVDL